MKIVTRMTGDEEFVASNDMGNEVKIDMRKVEEKKDQSPVELVLSALGACGAVDIVLMLKKRKKTVTHFVVETEGTRQEETPKYFTKIHCHFKLTSPDATIEELNKVVQLSLEKYCSVASSLRGDITHSAEVVR